MFAVNIKKAAKENSNFRTVLETGTHSQLVVMSILPGSEIGAETHEGTDQILVFVAGQGKAVINGESRPVEKHDVVFVPAGALHNFINTGDEDLKLYTVYAPPEHAPGTVHKTKEEAEKAEKS
ncbi:cupin domain-containing protein [Candidatus Microgenomates bacterium]|nr:cupin domain-containing protein [Candidatus Microgenomates bacterium]